MLNYGLIGPRVNRSIAAPHPFALYHITEIQG
jgi:hypothetical protein